MTQKDRRKHLSKLGEKVFKNKVVYEQALIDNTVYDIAYGKSNMSPSVRLRHLRVVNESNILLKSIDEELDELSRYHD